MANAVVLDMPKCVGVEEGCTSTTVLFRLLRKMWPTSDFECVGSLHVFGSRLGLHVCDPVVESLPVQGIHEMKKSGNLPESWHVEDGYLVLFQVCCHLTCRHPW